MEELRGAVMSQVPSKYLELIRSFRLRPIRSDTGLAQATKVLHQLLDAERLTVAERDYLDVLGNLIEDYEAQAIPIADLPPHEMLAAVMESREINQVQLAKETGIPVSTISELLSQRREFNVAHIEKLCPFFGLEPGAFIRV
jgi:HTH-type transcriptional regulator / antitoxin HigA